MDNGITFRQNLSENIRLLAAQRTLYSRTKWLAAAQAYIAGLTPLLGAVVVAINPAADVWAAFAGFVAAIADTAWLDPTQKRLRALAANFQEEFDCDVFRLPWNEALAGRHPTPEETHEAAESYIPSSSAPLDNWYPPAVSLLPLHHARLVCQRANCWWDSNLRRRYRQWVLFAFTILVAVVFAIGLLRGMSLQKFALAVMAPLLPAVLWAAREWRREADTISESDRLERYCECLCDQGIRQQLTEHETSRLSRELQDAILVRRRQVGPVFDWVYRKLRRRQEEQMKIGAEVMVARFQNGQSNATPHLAPR